MKKIPLTQGVEAMVDDEDFENISKYKWYANKNFNTFYARRAKTIGHRKQIIIQMHRDIIDIPKGMKIDHIDGNGLNNTKENLRIVTNRQNTQNKHTSKTSNYTGVCWSKTNNKWVANIKINGKGKYLGYFKNEIDAHNAYLNALKGINETYASQILSIKEKLN